MTWRVQLTDEARDGYDHLDARQRSAVDRGLRELADDPYRSGTRPEGKDPDRRTVAFGDVIVVYVISAGVLVVTVVHLIPL
ncbi:type II toxin-antitoxin system RelE family toxin [Embleya hyalina]|uniref:Type II toxin-antitoxin system RelE/ParE family toxin n=1 Tax=Embleya hyalina TaxID=516124 RepID=A0A401Z5T3_9ACTN|nr:type II toxin-antitoxin system RelE/ParE family toxin [Embleya hyalina]GCE02178.1 hypothetical protein EHYA_09955 [Embleya hyalina]